MKNNTPISERGQALILAAAVLDRPNADPDDDMAILARQLNRAHEAAEFYREALQRIMALNPEPFQFPADWGEQIAACPECKRYQDHPIQRGICDLHRKPLYARKRHEDHRQRTLIYRAQDVAKAAIRGERACTCHPDDRPPQPCPQKFALTECVAAASLKTANLGNQGG